MRDSISSNSDCSSSFFFVQCTVNRLWEHNTELRILNFKQLAAVERVRCWTAPIYFSNSYIRDLVIKITRYNRANFYDSNAYKITYIQPFVVPLQVTTSEVAHFDVIRMRANYDANSNKITCSFCSHHSHPRLAPPCSTSWAHFGSFHHHGLHIYPTFYTPSCNVAKTKYRPE